MMMGYTADIALLYSMWKTLLSCIHSSILNHESTDETLMVG